MAASTTIHMPVPGTIKPAAPVSKARVWTGRALSALVVLFLLSDGVMKFLKPAPVVEAFTQLGLRIELSNAIGTILLAGTVLYAIPRTAVLGAILLTGYLGGAVVSNLRVGNPLFSHTLFPIYFAAVLWTGLFLRDRRVRALIAAQDEN